MVLCLLVLGSDKNGLEDQEAILRKVSDEDTVLDKWSVNDLEIFPFLFCVENVWECCCLWRTPAESGLKQSSGVLVSGIQTLAWSRKVCCAQIEGHAGSTPKKMPCHWQPLPAIQMIHFFSLAFFTFPPQKIVKINFPPDPPFFFPMSKKYCSDKNPNLSWYTGGHTLNVMVCFMTYPTLWNVILCLKMWLLLASVSACPRTTTRSLNPPRRGRRALGALQVRSSGKLLHCPAPSTRVRAAERAAANVREGWRPQRAGSVWVWRGVAVPDAARCPAQGSIRLGLGLAVLQWPSSPAPPAITATYVHQNEDLYVHKDYQGRLPLCCYVTGLIRICLAYRTANY